MSSDNTDRIVRDLWTLLEDKWLADYQLNDEIEGITTWLFAWNAYYGQGTAATLQSGKRDRAG
jgi:hypothetical protein